MSKRLHQAGAALLAAMLTVTMVATFAAAALWQQWRAVEIEGAERARVQAAWLLTGALDWARLILRSDRTNADHLGEPWAVPLEEARLSTFLAADPSNNVDNEADRTFLSGQITDLQAMLNVDTLVRAGAVAPVPYACFQRLFDVLGLPQSQLRLLADGLRFANDIAPENLNAGRAPLAPQRLEQLVWLGVAPETVAALQPYVTVLPRSGTTAKVNLNTAPAEVIYAVATNISLADAQRLVAVRNSKHFSGVGEALVQLGAGAGFADNMVDIGSEFFEVRGRLRMDDVVVEQRSVVKHTGLNVTTLTRENVVLRGDSPAR
jgi:general secretion pathway protein K